MRLVVEYIYCGEVRVTQERLDSVMSVAEVLGIRGLLSSGQSQQPCKKRRLYEEGGGESQRSVITCSPSASNGGQARSPVVSRPSTARQPLSASSSGRPGGAGGVADITENFNDIRPDILEMIKEEQKVGPPWNFKLLMIVNHKLLSQAKLLEPNTNWNSSSSANMPPGMI